MEVPRTPTLGTGRLRPPPLRTPVTGPQRRQAIPTRDTRRMAQPLAARGMRVIPLPPVPLQAMPVTARMRGMRRPRALPPGETITPHTPSTALRPELRPMRGMPKQAHVPPNRATARTQDTLPRHRASNTRGTRPPPPMPMWVTRQASARPRRATPVTRVMRPGRMGCHSAMRRISRPKERPMPGTAPPLPTEPAASLP